MKYAILLTLVFFFSSPRAFSGIHESTALRIITDNVENSFEVGTKAVFFVEVLTDFEYPSGEAEIVVVSEIIGSPTITLSGTKIRENYYSFISPKLKITDVGRRYIQAKLQTRPKKEANRIRNAIEKTSALIAEEIVKRDSASSEIMRQYHQLQINRLETFSDSLDQQLNDLLTPVGAPAELAFTVRPQTGQIVNVLTSLSHLSLAEGESAEYEIKLDSRPTSDVIISVSTTATGVILNKESGETKLIFTPENFNIAQKIHVKARTNTTAGDSRGVLINHEAYSLDARYNNSIIESLHLEILDVAPNLSVVNFLETSTTTMEGSTVEVKITLSSPASETITIPYTVCGTAEYSSDHNISDGEFVFLPGQIESSLLVTINQDEDNQELDEDITLVLSPPAMAQLGENREYLITILASTLL